MKSRFISHCSVPPLCLCLLLVTLISCACCSRPAPPTPSTVKYVFPNGYRGSVRVFFGTVDDHSNNEHGNAHTIHIFSDGTATLHDNKSLIFDWQIVQAAYEDGTAILIGDSATPSTAVAMWQSGDLANNGLLFLLGRERNGKEWENRCLKIS